MEVSNKYESAIVLINPKHPFNLGGAIRACAALGSSQLYWTGDRVIFDTKNLPSEEKRKDTQQSVKFARRKNALQKLKKQGFTPVAVELKDDAENILFFDHPPKAVYVFGPEDGSLEREVYQQCHRFIYIPTHFCLNLAAAVNVVLYDRRIKGMQKGVEPVLPLSQMLKNDLPEISISGRIRDGFQGK